MNKQVALDDETIANNVRETLNKLRHVQSAGLPGKRSVILFILSLLTDLLFKTAIFSRKTCCFNTS